MKKMAKWAAIMVIALGALFVPGSWTYEWYLKSTHDTEVEKYVKVQEPKVTNYAWSLCKKQNCVDNHDYMDIHTRLDLLEKRVGGGFSRRETYEGVLHEICTHIARHVDREVIRKTGVTSAQDEEFRKRLKDEQQPFKALFEMEAILRKMRWNAFRAKTDLGDLDQAKAEFQKLKRELEALMTKEEID